MKRKKWYFHPFTAARSIFSMKLSPHVTFESVRVPLFGPNRRIGWCVRWRSMRHHHRLVPKGRSGLGCFAIQQKLLAHGRGPPHHSARCRLTPINFVPIAASVPRAA